MTQTENKTSEASVGEISYEGSLFGANLYHISEEI
jgi:hypothetical protein